MIDRKILFSVLVIGAVAAVAGGSTLALFNDSETSSGNVFTAGAVDLKVDYNESYNGVFQESQNLTDNPGNIFNLTDVKPGDEGEATISLHVYQNPSYIWMRLDNITSTEAGCTEPEADAEGGDCGTQGELYENLNFTLWYDDGDNIRQEDERLIATGNTTSVAQPQQPAPQPGQVCRNVTGSGVDLSVVMDRSGSMFGTPLDSAKNGSQVLVNSLGTSDQSSLVSFSSSATLDQELTFNHSETDGAIETLSAGGGTSIESGVRVSTEELVNGSNARDNASKVMVVLSDGVGSGDPVAAANESKDAGVRVITIAYGTFADNETLRKMASSEDDFYNEPNISDIEETFGNISKTICEPVNDTNNTNGNVSVPVDQSRLEQGILLDGDPASNDTKEAFTNSTTEYIGLKWELPRDVGNEAQLDAASFDLQFYAEQERNNPDPQNPFG